MDILWVQPVVPQAERRSGFVDKPCKLLVDQPEIQHACSSSYLVVTYDITEFFAGIFDALQYRIASLL